MKVFAVFSFSFHVSSLNCSVFQESLDEQKRSAEVCVFVLALTLVLGLPLCGEP